MIYDFAGGLMVDGDGRMLMVTMMELDDV